MQPVFSPVKGAWLLDGPPQAIRPKRTLEQSNTRHSKDLFIVSPLFYNPTDRGFRASQAGPRLVSENLFKGLAWALQDIFSALCVHDDESSEFDSPFDERQEGHLHVQSFNLHQRFSGSPGGIRKPHIRDRQGGDETEIDSDVAPLESTRAQSPP